MIPYGTDSSERSRLSIGLIFVSMIISPPITSLLNQGLAAIGHTLPWFIESPSPLLVFSAFYFLLDNWAWRWPLLRWLGLVKIPDLNGTWDGVLQSSETKFQDTYPVELEINQTWTRIRVRLRARSSRSNSTSVGIEVESPLGTTLSYEYLSEPYVDARESMNVHRGTARLGLTRSDTDDLLAGDYYTGRSRNTYGTMRFVRRRRKFRQWIAGQEARPPAGAGIETPSPDFSKVSLPPIRDVPECEVEADGPPPPTPIDRASETA